MKRIYLFIIFILIIQCEKVEQTKIYLYLRSGYNYQGFSTDLKGNAQSFEGTCSFYDEKIEIRNRKITKEFKLKSIKNFHNNLLKYIKIPYIGKKTTSLSKVEIYVNNKIVYETYMLDSDFWEIIMPILKEIPNEVNPFYIGTATSKTTALHRP